MNLITGASGLVGSHVLYQLLSEQQKVKALIRSESAINHIKNVFTFYTDKHNEYLSRIEWVFGDVTNIHSLQRAFEGVTKVYHCAAYISFAEKDFSLMKKVNINGTANIVNQCLGSKDIKLLHVSSIAAIGKPSRGNVYDESCGWPQGRISPYAFTKTNSELEVWRGISEGLDAVIINPSVIIGPGNWQSGSGKLFSRIAKGMMFYTSGVTGFVDVRDVANIMILLMNSDISGERYIVNSENYSYKELFNEIATELEVPVPKIEAKKWMMDFAWRISKAISLLTGREPVITKHSSKISKVKQFYNAEKLKLELNYDMISVKQGICHTVKCYLIEQQRDKFYKK